MIVPYKTINILEPLKILFFDQYPPSLLDDTQATEKLKGLLGDSYVETSSEDWLVVEESTLPFD